MKLLMELADLLLNLDEHIGVIIQQYGAFTYFILFLIIFCETGLVVTPFLPGDSLIFVVGTFAAKDSLNLGVAAIIFVIAAIAGDTVNYHIGKFIGPKIFEKKKLRFLKREHLVRTHAFYERHGGKTILIARFIPVIRTFAPFVAGVGEMAYSRFLGYNVMGGALWITLFLNGGYFFGNMPLVKDHFTLVILAIIFISILPGVVSYFSSQPRGRMRKFKGIRR